ncbi:MAG TPA: Hsp70 family protein [Eubacteriales bacterium]|jgi:molecular chaperone DnaK (HSP70)|nr:Hsp70 family protein [Eubacteriales bacterium]HRU84262.1 Hsp70 family protein [Eubacteriales bacterium]
MNFKIGLDLGTETLKVCFAAIGESGKAVYGKADSLSELPAMGYFELESGKWIFGEKIFIGASERYETLVRIKELLKLLDDDSTAECYHSGNTFKKFGAELSRSLSGHYEPDFTASNTPKSVAEKFFKYAVEVYIKSAFDKMPLKETADRLTKKCVLTFPQNAGDRYKRELVRLAEFAGLEVEKCLSEPTAVGLYAAELNRERYKDTSALVVDIGESRVSVAEIYYNYVGFPETRRYVAGKNVGGKDYDEAVKNYVISECGIVDEMPAFQKFSLNRNIKIAKEFLQHIDPAVVECDSLAVNHVNLSRATFARLTDNITAEIAGAVKESLVKFAAASRIILSGGCCQSAALQLAVKQATVMPSRVTAVDTLGRDSKLFDMGAVYAAAAGAALFSTGLYKTIDVTARSYGVEVFDSSKQQDVLSVIIPKNTPLPAKVTRRYSTYSSTQRVVISVHSTLAETNVPIGRETALLCRESIDLRRGVYKGFPLEVTITVDENGIGRAKIAAGGVTFSGASFEVIKKS